MAAAVEKTQRALPSYSLSNCRRRAIDLSSMVTSAFMPTAIDAALSPTTPPPITRTLAGATPGTPANKTPLPP